MSGPRLSIIPAGAVLDRSLKNGDLRILCLLGRHTDDEGWCRRSQVKMARELDCARSTVQASINRLIEAGWVSRRMISTPHEQGERDSAHEYRVILDPENNPADPCRYTGTPAAISAPPADPASAPINEPIINDSIPHCVRNAARAPKRNVVLDELMAVLDEEHAVAVIEHRKAMRRPLTVHAAKMLARQFAQVPNPNAGADAMIGNGWQGFDPEWLKRQSARNNRSPPNATGQPLTAAQKLRNAIELAEGTENEHRNGKAYKSLDGELWAGGKGCNGRGTDEHGRDCKRLSPGSGGQGG